MYQYQVSQYYNLYHYQLTFARSSGAVLPIDVDTETVSAVVFRRRIVAVASPELETVGAARRPRRPRRPLAIHRRTNLGTNFDSYYFFLLLPAFPSQIFLAAHFRFHGWGSVTRWAQLLITSNYYLPITAKEQSMMRAELTE